MINRDSKQDETLIPGRDSGAEETRSGRRGFLAGIEHGIYLILRLPVFLFLVVFRRFAGR